ncbi:tetratricopeptide repeat protein [Clostridioides difficile]|nr:tetratricopeptide repeat protein [Clostridioides difficile]MDL5102373.1 tetratricopeptide repeat protein [Clostridioides difficile]
MSKEFLSSICFYFVVFTIVILLLFLNKKDNKLQILKKLVLVIIISMGLFSSFYLIFGNSKNYNTDEVGIGLSIFGMLATAWVGLNIYNVIEKKEIENMQRRVEDIVSKMDKVDKKISDTENRIDKKILETEKRMFISSMLVSINIENDSFKKIPYAEQIIKKYPEDEAGYLELGNICYYTKNIEGAAILIEEALKINPKNPRAYLIKGQILKDKRKFDEAIHNFNKYIELDDKNQEVYFEIAKAYMDDHSFKTQSEENEKLCRAIENFTKAIDLGRKETDVYMYRGIAYKNMKNYDKAIDDIKQAKDLFDEYDIFCKCDKEMIEKELKDIQEKKADAMKEKNENLNE